MSKGSGGSRTVDKTHKRATFEMTESIRQKLKSNGFSIYSNQVEKYNQSDLKNFNIEKIDNLITKLAKDSGVDMRMFTKEIKIDKATQRISFFSGERNEDGRPKFWIDVSFSRNDTGQLEAYHEYYSIPSNAQGKGYAKKINKALVDQYKNIGVSRVTLDAGSSVGGYAWAQQGFYARNIAEARNVLRTVRSDNDRRQVESVIEKFYSSHSATTPFPMSNISSLPNGKNILLGSKWKGFLDLHDKSQMSRFNKYVK